MNGPVSKEGRGTFYAYYQIIRMQLFGVHYKNRRY